MTRFTLSADMIDDALRFMRVPNEGRDAELREVVRRTFDELETIIRPRVVWGRFSVMVINSSEGAGIRVGMDSTAEFEIKSSDLAKLMVNSHECYLMAVTIGSDVDRKILLAQARGMLDGLMLDACASVRADALCNQTEHEIVASLGSGEVLTPRFSPGYGDAPLEASRDIITALDATRRIGLSMTRSFMMTPVKSITALAGVISGEFLPVNGSTRACETCHVQEHCLYKMKGEYCGKHR